MKNNFKIFLFGAFALIAVIIISCTNEKETFATSNGLSLSIVGNPADAPTVLTNATLANGFATFIWTRTDNGTPSESSYILEISDRDIPESSRVYREFDNTISGVFSFFFDHNHMIKIKIRMQEIDSYSCEGWRGTTTGCSASLKNLNAQGT